MKWNKDFLNFLQQISFLLQIWFFTEEKMCQIIPVTRHCPNTVNFKCIASSELNKFMQYERSTRFHYVKWQLHEMVFLLFHPLENDN